MKPVKIVLNDRSKRKDLTGRASEDPKPYRNPFGDSDSSDSESEKPKVRQISSFSAARPISPPKRPSPPPLPPPPKSGPKGSQIARLLARRKEAAAGLEKESRDARDEALFRYDVDRCDDVATDTGYAKRPVEGFGELMLRSMGWQGTPDIADVSDPTPRPTRLGLGAKLEDLPPNLSAKRRKLGLKGTQDGRAIDKSKTNLQHVAVNDEGKAANANRPADRYGVTAESTSRVVEPTKEIATKSTTPPEKGEIRARQGRKRSRFSNK